MKPVIEPIIGAAAEKATYATAGTTVVAGLMNVDSVYALIGALTAGLVAGVTIYCKLDTRKRQAAHDAAVETREQELHAARLGYLRANQHPTREQMAAAAKLGIDVTVPVEGA